MKKQQYRFKCKFCEEKSFTKIIMQKHILKEHEEELFEDHYPISQFIL